MEKLLNTLSNNLGYTVVLVASVVLFAIFSGGLINGIITAISAILAYTCVMLLVREYKNTPDAKKKKSK